MLWIHAAGAAYPATVITDKFLEELQGVTTTDGDNPPLSIESRRSVLPDRYLRLTKNTDVRLAEMVAEEKPSTLGATATTQAVRKAGLTVEEIGLILGDSVTQFQLVPTEGQRVAGNLGLRIPAYEVVGAGGAFGLHLQNILHWKPMRLPKYFVSVSTNTPTAFVDYSTSGAGRYVGDSAGALVISATFPNGLRVWDAQYSSGPVKDRLFESGLSTPLIMDASKAADYIHERAAIKLEEAISKHSLNPKETLVVGCELETSKALKTCHNLRIPEANYFSTVPTIGYSFGSSLYTALAEHWNVIVNAPATVCVFAGAGPCEGYVVVGAE